MKWRATIWSLVLAAILVAEPICAQDQDRRESITRDSIEQYLSPTPLRRLAFIVGVDTYPKLEETVPNAISDAKLIDRTLRTSGLNFEVSVVFENPTARELYRALDNFAAQNLNRGSKAAIVFFYFAGHGFSKNGNNFIVATNANIGQALGQGSLGITEIRDRLQTDSTAVLIMLFDSCRNELTKLKMDVDYNHTRVPEDPDRIFFGFASGAGKTALSSTSESPKNSPFAFALNKYLGNSNKDLNYIFDREIRQQVENLSRPHRPPPNRPQSPVAYGMRTADLYLRPPEDFVADQRDIVDANILRAYGLSDAQKRRKAECRLIKIRDTNPGSENVIRINNFLRKLNVDERRFCEPQ